MVNKILNSHYYSAAFSAGALNVGSAFYTVMHVTTIFILVFIATVFPLSTQETTFEL